MALKSLELHHAQNITNSQGIVPFDGTSGQHYQWEFKTEMIHLQILDPDAENAAPDAKHKNAQVVNRVIQGLTLDALNVAMDIGVARLAEKDGIPHLIAEMKKVVFPSKKLEAKELYAQGHYRHGPLSRQSNESMISYVSRRKRWWIMLKAMDPDLTLSAEIRGDLMLDASGLSEHERLMVLTSTVNDTDFDKIADALQKQHGKIHVRHQPMQSRTFGDRRNNQRKFHKPRFARKAYYAGPDDGYDDDWDDDYEYDDADDYSYAEPCAHYASNGYENVADYAHYSYDDGGIETPSVPSRAYYSEIDQRDEEYVVDDEDAYLDILDEVENEGQECDVDAVALLCQAQLGVHVAYAAFGPRGRGKGKGKGKGKFRPFSKGEGKFARKGYSSFGKGKGKGKSSASLADRKRRLQELKKRTRCQDCGEVGHWKGDSECRKKAMHAQIASSTAFVAASSESFMDQNAVATDVQRADVVSSDVFARSDDDRLICCTDSGTT